MRQGRTEFPAVVLQQHPDDGSLDLIVWFEAEDQIWEQRVRQYTVAQPGHCWELIQPLYNLTNEKMDALDKGIFHMHDEIEALQRHVDVVKDGWRWLKEQMYGDYEAPSKSMIEYLDDFDVRLKKLEKLLRK